ncbi:MAG: hypothetical protein A3F84_04150 [Candidatus Handelsmanbacteria bacterium RIFCSPLOWO2_12_FULL_64_10]|uniref:FAD-binding PCMH-type domain-containing protein n=1 Tax=Handelsmanbacteria sp. (strain RIFCSPLOWO2_12_FULL_64_10) TaxID=1817868 RepID=A0A1F6CAI9_HANXR|nr:MAG: hypothetical protein A3F84_04150 [Candidatus Handelsmanbacteria bacterium RIFCSPLOWO2_12_FULL_64_10]
MFPNVFEYYRANSVAEAIALLTKYGDDARPISGGQSLVPLMKLRLVNPGVIVDLNPIPGLDYVRRTDGVIELGGLVRHAEAESAALLKQHLPVVVDAVELTGDMQVRNRGTVGGVIAEADPGGDWGAALLAVNGKVECEGPNGKRVIDGPDFYLDFLTTALGPGEIVTGVQLPVPAARSGGAYLKLERRSGDFAVVGAAVQLTVGADGTCQEIGIGLSGVGTIPIKATEAERALKGTKLTDADVAEAARLVDGAIEPLTDVRASAEYRRAMAGVYFKRALKAAQARVK